MQTIISRLNQKLLRLAGSIGLLLSFCLEIAAQPVPTFEMTIATPAITQLELIPGTNQFYAIASNSGPDALLPIIMKIDTSGNIIQQWQYNLPAMKRLIRCKVTADGGLLILGSRGYSDTDTIYCVLLTPGGQVAWYRSYYLEGESISGSDILQVSDGGIVVSGSIGMSNDRRDAFLLKMDNTGSTAWMKRFSVGVNMDALGGGIIEKNGVLIFCSAIEQDDFFGPHSIRLSRLALSDGSLLSVKDFVGESIGFDDIKIFDDFHGGFYIAAATFIYRSPCQTVYILKLDGNLQLLYNYAIAGRGIFQGFGVLKDGTLNAGHRCFGYIPYEASSTITKVSTDGKVVYAGYYPGALTKAPYSPDTLVVISGAVEIGNHVFAAGRKNGKAFITALNTVDLSANNCSLFGADAQLNSETFDTIDVSWPTVTNAMMAAASLSASRSNPGLTPVIATCNVSPFLYVDKNANGLNDGSSWQNAYTSLAAAIDKMNGTAAIKTILVAAGTYSPAPAAAFIINKYNAVLLGGFPAGGGTRDPATNVVILQGEVNAMQSVRIDGFRVE